MSQEQTPATWSELQLSRLPYLDTRLDALPETAVKMRRPGLPVSPGPLPGAAVLLAELVTIRGVAAARPHFDLFLPYAAELYVTAQSSEPANAIAGVLSFQNMAQCCGFDSSSSFGPMQKQWLGTQAKRRAKLHPLDCQSLAFHALAFAEDHLVPALLSLKQPSFEPGRKWQFNYPGLIAYLSAAATSAATPEQVEPAWLDFLQSFPYKLSAQSVKFPHLFCVARAVLHRIHGIPLGEVARETHKIIVQWIARGQ